MAKETENTLLRNEEAEQLEEKSQEIIRKLDKESATRKFTNPLMKKIFFVACLLVSCYHLYTAAFGPPVTLVHRSLHVAMILALGFLMYPAGKSSDMTKPSILDWILAALSFAAPIYIYTDYLGVVERAGNPNDTDLAMATLPRHGQRAGDPLDRLHHLRLVWAGIPGHVHAPRL